MARITCRKCGHNWVRRVRISRGQLIRCPKCRITLGKMSKPMKPEIVKKYVAKWDFYE